MRVIISLSFTTFVQTKKRNASIGAIGQRGSEHKQQRRSTVAGQLHLHGLHSRGHVRADVQFHIRHNRRGPNSLHTVRVDHRRMRCTVHYVQGTFVCGMCILWNVTKKNVTYLVQGMTAPNRCTAVQYNAATLTCTLLQKSAMQTTPLTGSNIQSVFKMFTPGLMSDVYAEQVSCLCVSLYPFVCLRWSPVRTPMPLRISWAS
jgi:hypothetical protein